MWVGRTVTPELIEEALVDFWYNSALLVPNPHERPVEKQLLSLFSFFHLSCYKSIVCYLGIEPITFKSSNCHDLTPEALPNTLPNTQRSAPITKSLSSDSPATPILTLAATSGSSGLGIWVLVPLRLQW